LKNQEKTDMSLRAWKTIFLVWGILFIGDITKAVPITIKITGVVTEITGSEPNPYNETIYTGSTFTGTYIYDSETIGQSILPGRGHYAHNSPYGFNLSLGGFEFKAAENHVGQFGIVLYNDFFSQYDGYTVVSRENMPLSSALEHIITWELRDNTRTALSSIALPLDAPDLSAWDFNLFSIGFSTLGRDNFLFTIRGTVTETMRIPEPATMLVLGLGGLLIRKR
jgi:hypothetical protein